MTNAMDLAPNGGVCSVTLHRPLADLRGSARSIVVLASSCRRAAGQTQRRFRFETHLNGMSKYERVLGVVLMNP